MKAIILAGGRGERLRPLTNKIPKPMIKVGDQPILLHIINLFKQYGVKDFIIALCYLPNVITDFFGDGSKFGVKIEYSYEDPNKPLGTAGAVLLSKNLINDTFIVTSGDILRTLDIRKMINFHKRNKAFTTINLYKRVNKNAKSIIIIDKNKQITKFVERPSEDDLKREFIWSNGSFYIFEREVLQLIDDDKKLDFGFDIFPKLLKEKKTILGFTSDEYFVDIGDLVKLKYARQTFPRLE